ncbi:FapA family protein [bacterium]|nr:FapA family protein [bacterium]
MATETLQISDFTVVSHSYDAWKVRFSIPLEELVDQKKLLFHLRRIKRGIAERFTVPESLLLFDGIDERHERAEYVDVVVRIRREAQKGSRPTVRFKDGIGADQSRYTHMTALLDAHWLDEFDRPVTLDRIMETIQKAGISPELVNQEVISGKITDVLSNQGSVKDLIIAQGRFPDLGQDATLEFYFPMAQEATRPDDYFSMRKVSGRDLLCKKGLPTRGTGEGVNVLGQPLPPRAGLDFELRSGNGATLSLDGTEITADMDGVVVVNRVLKRVRMVTAIKEIPESVTIKVNPVLRIEGNQIVDVTTSHTVEVIGDLCMGSRITTDCEVYVAGNVEDGALIEATDDITVKGSVTGASLTSQSSIYAGQDVSDSRLVSAEKIVVKGRVSNSDVFADTVEADAVSGSNITARRSVILSRIDADENNILSTISVGMDSFLLHRVEENGRFIERAKSNLMRLEMLFGPDVVRQTTSNNVQAMLMHFLKEHRAEMSECSGEQMELYRKLLESIPPTRALMDQKRRENMELVARIRHEQGESGNMIVIREKMAGRTVLAVNDTEAEVEPLNRAAKVTADGQGNLIISPPDPKPSSAPERSAGATPDAR